MAHAIPKVCLVVAEGRKEKKREGKKRGKFCSLIMCMFGNKEEKRIISFVWFVKRKEIYVGKFHIVLLLPFYIPIK